MLKHKKYLLQVFLFCALAIFCVSKVNDILIPKYFYNVDWAPASTYADFYHMKKDSIDVIFLGSSHCVAGFSPIELYEKYGIRSYNLGCEQQNLLLSYYWLEEALRFQKPQYVFLETYMLFPYDRNSVLNASEAASRKAMDFMKWSDVKLSAIRDICAIDKEQKLSSYIFPNERFHTRWQMLSEDDFCVKSMSDHESLMGYFPLNFTFPDDSYVPFRKNGTAEYADMLPVMREYLDKIVTLCAEHDIELVLTKTPTRFYSSDSYHAVSRYALENEIEYIDFNEEGVYYDAGIDFTQDTCDTDHVNIQGARKLSDYIGKWLLDKIRHGYKDEQWEKRAAYYRHYLKDESLSAETDLGQYLEMLCDHNYSVLIAVMGEASEILCSEKEAFGRLGLALPCTEKSGESYLAVIDAKKVRKELAGSTRLEEKGTIRNGRTVYQMMSAGTEHGDSCSILLNGSEVSLEHPGLNIVVYCKDEKRMADRVCFYMEQGEIRCIR